MTYRERRERKAERLREWADKRDGKADAAYDAAGRIASLRPFGQPILVGHHSERGARADQARIERNMNATLEHSAKAADFRSRADNIERAAKTAIYSDDPDAAERLTEKIARLEAQRDGMKVKNAEYRKAHAAELRGMSAYERGQAVPYPSWAITNATANISRLRKRLESIETPRPDRVMPAKYGGTCADCGATIERGDMIRYSRGAGARCETC